MNTCEWFPVATKPKEFGFYLAYAPVTEMSQPPIIATWFDPKEGWFELCDDFRDRMSHWAVMPAPPNHTTDPRLLRRQQRNRQ